MIIKRDSEDLAMRLEMTLGDDWHLHLRDGIYLKDNVRATARQFGRAIIMPNTGPIITVPEAKAYRERILAARPPGSTFEPLMTLYNSPRTTRADIREAKESGIIFGLKDYPRGATTGSDQAPLHFRDSYPIFEECEEQDLVVNLHGEKLVNNRGEEVDAIDREEVFLEEEFFPLREKFPSLRIVLEHITTSAAVEATKECSVYSRTAATITPHHPTTNMNHLLGDKLRPHLFNKPVNKRIRDQKATNAACVSGLSCFFLGTDSAPWNRASKECDCGCAGCYNANCALELYAEIFENAGVLKRLEAFVSHYGADFYGLPRHTEMITLVRQPWKVPFELPYGDGETIVPFAANRELEWLCARTFEDEEN